MLLRLVAHIYCDRCGSIGKIVIEDDFRLVSGRKHGLDAMIEDAIRTTQYVAGGFGSIVGGEMRCEECTAQPVRAEPEAVLA